MVRVKTATEPWEFEQIHRLNYRTFVEEIPQHRADPSGILVDRFHHENTYIIAVDRRTVLGMIAIRSNRPFSLDAKLPDLDRYLPPGRRICEFRLLAVEKPHRAGRLLHRLMSGVWQHCREQGFTLAVMSGTTRQLKLYRHLGFVPFGPMVGEPGAHFQPMMLTIEAAQPLVRRVLTPDAAGDRIERLNLLPGPVTVRDDVQEALSEPATSHRSRSFQSDFTSTQTSLCRLTGARRAEVLLGSGTLANDAIAGQLSLGSASGLILSNGEFGDRLADHATRFALRCEVMRWPWGEPFDLSAVERRLATEPAPGWLWFVHLETSTGVLNDLASLKTLCRRNGVDLCVDTVSSLGLVPFDLEHVRFASSASAKGLGAFPGLAIVLHDGRLEPPGRLPRYLDLQLYASDGVVPFTHSSNLVNALRIALEGVDWPERFKVLSERSRWLRALLRERGYTVVGTELHAAPGVVTIALPSSVGSVAVGTALEDQGMAIAANSGYLRHRNWIQIGVMAEPSRRQLRGVVDALDRVCTTARSR